MVGILQCKGPVCRLPGGGPPDSSTIKSMMIGTGLKSFAAANPWSMELVVALSGLLIGVGLMPILIFYAGAFALGRYEGASVGHLYHSLFVGLGQASIASWAVLLGPYGLYLLFKGLRLWWRASAHLA